MFLVKVNVLIYKKSQKKHSVNEKVEIYALNVIVNEGELLVNNVKKDFKDVLQKYVFQMMKNVLLRN